MLRQEAVLTMEFIHGVVLGENATGFFRDPLAAIRSSAELALETDDTGAREAAGDIIAEVDRLGPGGTP